MRVSPVCVYTIVCVHCYACVYVSVCVFISMWVCVFEYKCGCGCMLICESCTEGSHQKQIRYNRRWKSRWSSINTDNVHAHSMAHGRFRGRRSYHFIPPLITSKRSQWAWFPRPAIRLAIWRCKSGSLVFSPFKIFMTSGGSLKHTFKTIPHMSQYVNRIRLIIMLRTTVVRKKRP